MRRVDRREFLGLVLVSAPMAVLGAGDSQDRVRDTAAGSVADRHRDGDEVTLFLCGDVMTGRGIDQVLPHPGNPQLHEAYVKDARRYVELARRAGGEFPRPVEFAYPWGAALEELERVRPAARIANLETAVTTSSDFARGKAVHYRMSPANVPCLAAAGLDCCVLANNHVLDWGIRGLLETLDTLQAAGIRTAGAGRDIETALSPAVIETGADDAGRERRVLVHAVGSTTSGIPSSWAATPDRPGIALLGEAGATPAELGERLRSARRAGDVAVCSVHWGSNWGWMVPATQRELAHDLIDVAGFDLVYGHSSHHVRGIEIHRGRLILYGCGDLLNDYEGIGGREEYRGDLGLMYFPRIDAGAGRLTALAMTPTRVRRYRIEPASNADARWLAATLERESRPADLRFELEADGRLECRLPPPATG